jgi:hypothetical protein
VAEIELAEPDGSVRIVSYEETARGNRFVSWGGSKKSPGSEAAALWTLPLKEIVGAEIKRISMAEPDFKVTFRDGSWVRLTSSPHGAGGSSACSIKGWREQHHSQSPRHTPHLPHTIPHGLSWRHDPPLIASFPVAYTETTGEINCGPPRTAHDCRRVCHGGSAASDRLRRG